MVDGFVYYCQLVDRYVRGRLDHLDIWDDRRDVVSETLEQH